MYQEAKSVSTDDVMLIPKWPMYYHWPPIANKAIVTFMMQWMIAHPDLHGYIMFVMVYNNRLWP